MEAICQMLEVLSFCDREKAFKTSFNKNKTSNFSNEKKVQWSFNPSSPNSDFREHQFSPNNINTMSSD